ncbi:predicted protein [Naegleria gruberi]|uniref:Predicted protein n=1 Tax=Naegleria gruberi TaxID=5762 RepID=D2V5W2_NAEGR|nr:uncharacterized protein NAEGRDRAFT_64222 [Naegleria gruberi]EFC47866.1 predicted protein [Naegleria gruberi]|eukprot:XP_002680610.1 predicted protein [Naegleria gruberi strain NEG-M]
MTQQTHEELFNENMCGSALPTEIKYGDRSAEDTLLNNCIKFLIESPRLSNMSEIAKVLIKEPDCKDACMGLERLIFRVVHNADSKEASGFLGYSNKVNGTELVVTLDCNLSLDMKDKVPLLILKLKS